MADQTGGAGPNNLAGGATADVLSGGLGADTLSGGGGADVLYGSGPADVDPNSGTIRLHQLPFGFEVPVAAMSAPGRPDHLFVLEITGAIRIMDVTTEEKLAAFLTIPQAEIGAGGERGVIGLAFRPDYAASGKFYINLANPDGDIEIWEYTRSAADPNVADAASKRLILTIDHPNDRHYGGWMEFGPDGLLYISTGDNNIGPNPGNPAQDPNSLLGKILRIDVTSDGFPADPARNYAVPAENPFVGRAGADEIWALGLRNPWRAAFDPATGDLFIGDVGEAAREEINVIRAGEPGGLNFGWAAREGTLGADNPAFTDPAIEIVHGSGPFNGRSVVGGYVYDGPGGAQGLYIYGDFAVPNLWAARFVDGRPESVLNLNDAIRADGGDLSVLTAFGVDGSGRLYAMAVNGGFFRLDFSAGAGDSGDRLDGGEGDDRLYGGAGADLLIAGAGQDTLSGGLGGDTLEAGPGGTRLSGGAGADLFVFTAAPKTAARITDFALGTDKLDLWRILGPTYGGADPTADGYIRFQGGPGGAQVLYDADGSGSGAASVVLTLEGVATASLSWSQVAGGERPPPAAGGQVVSSPNTPTTLTGGPGNDTVIAGRSRDTLTGGEGADHFRVDQLPWGPSLVTDFQDGADRLDLRALFQANGYAGSSPVADGHLTFDAIEGGTRVSIRFDGLNNGWPYSVIDLQGVSPGQLSAADVIWRDGAAEPPPPPPPPTGGQVVDSDQTPTTLTGGAGNDTVVAGRSRDTLTGGEGADHFRVDELPWSPSIVTDFQDGTDRLDLRALLQAQGYAGSDPVADGAVRFDAVEGGTRVSIQFDGLNNGWPYSVIDLQGVSPGQLSAADLVWGSGPPPPPPPPTGQVVDSDQTPTTLTGGAGNDTIVAGRSNDTLTGGEGADHFRVDELPWSPSVVTDFQDGADKLDLRALFQAQGYSGSDPIADGHLLIEAREGGVRVSIDFDGLNNGWPYSVIDLQGVSASQITLADVLWR